MKENILAARYAKGLAQVARENNELEKVREDLVYLADLLDAERGDITVPELGHFLYSPTVPLREKIRATDVLCEEMGIGKTVSDFLNVLLKYYRINIINLIVREYERLSYEYEDAQLAVVETARRLTPEQRQKLTAALEQHVGGKVRLQEMQTPRLLGGLRVKLNDTVLDGSVRGRLRRLGTKLA